MQLSASDVDWTALDPAERQTLEEVIPRIQDGFTVKEIAGDLGIDAAALQLQVDHLAARVMALSGRITLPPLTDEEYEALKASLAEHGQQMPILVGSPSSGLPGEIVDGRHRRRACAQLKIDPIYKDVDGTADQLRSLGFVLNMARRQLSTSSRRGIVKAELLRDAARSDRAIAAAVGVSHPTVATVRRELEHAGTVERVSTRTGADGVAQPVRARDPQPPATERAVRVLVAAELYEQLVGPWVTCKAFRLVERRPGVHELQVQLLDAAPATAEAIADVRGRAQLVAAKTGDDQDAALAQLLANASDVFGRAIDDAQDLFAQEAEWITDQADVLIEGSG